MNENIEYQITSGKFVVWKKEKSFTSIAVIDLKSRGLKIITINETQKIFLCEVHNNKLIIGMLMCHLQIVDIDNGTSIIIDKGVPTVYYQLEESEISVAVYNDGTATVIDKDFTEIYLGRNDFFCSYLDDSAIFCDRNGRIIIVDNKKVYDIYTEIKSVQQIGINSDTKQLFLANKGKIYVFE